MRGLLLVLALAMLAGVLWWQFASDGAAAEPRPQLPHVATSADAATTPVAPAADAGAATDRTAVPPATATGSAPAVETFDYRLRFVTAGERAPLADVEVHWVDSTFPWATLTPVETELRERDNEAFLRKVGRRAVADGAGRLRLQASPNGLSLVARREQHFADVGLQMQSVPEPEGPFAGELVVELQADRELRFRTVDERGQPVPGIVTCLTIRTEPVSAFNLPATDTAGCGAVKHCQRFGPVRKGIGADLCARLAGGDGAPVAVDLGSPPEEPVDVRVPANGSLEVALLDPDGKPWTINTHNTMEVWVESGQQRSSVDRAFVAGDGRAVFPRVPCGIRLEVTTNGPFGGKTVDGPTRAGERVRVELRLPADVVIVIGRLLDPTSAPIADGVTAVFESDHALASQELDLDATGRFRIPLHSFVGLQPTIAFQFRRQPEQPVYGEAEVVLPRPLQAGSNDLGNIVLMPPPVLCAGTVRMADGSVPKDARLELERAKAGEDAEWRPAWDLPVSLDQQGRFEVRALPRGRRYRLQVQGATPVPPVEFAPGTTDLAIVLAQGGSVTATFLLDASIDPTEGLEFRLVAQATKAGSVGERDFATEMAERGLPRVDGERTKLQWSGLAAGPHRLLVACPGVDNLVDLEVAVPPGGAATDARLCDIDLRGRLRCIAVRVTARSGRAIADARVLLRGDEREWGGRDLPPGGAAKFLVTRPVDVLVLAAGCRGQLLPAVFADTAVALDAAPTVTLHWPAANALPADIGAALRCTPAGIPAQAEATFRQGGSLRSGGLGRELLGDATECALTDGRVTLRGECPVPIRVQLSLSRKGKRSQILPLQPELLDFTALADGQVVELRCDPAALQQALTTLGGN